MKRDRKTKSGAIRIISGQYKGRKLPVLDAQGLRPTTDRVKETVFNWLMHDLLDAKCLDLFAGSGGLGFEALSRHASHVCFVEKDKLAKQQIDSNLQTLKVGNSRHDVIQQDALTFLESQTEKFDIVFIDPPFGKDLVRPSVERILKSKLLHKDGLIYIEHELPSSIDLASQGLVELKSKRTSSLCFSLWQAAPSIP